ncbi:MAG TPA: LD-carboxypeptidase [Gemmatimonadaceae bacterium]|nr:LD-carboxypeptidase [Gemmatimonadaceae bacterium]
MPLAPIRPVSPLKQGARVALVAPAGTLAGPEDVARAEENARSLGWEPRTGAHVLKKHRYFAGTDEERLRDLNDAIRDDDIDAIWCLRGGYGAMRLLPDVDFDALANRPKPVIGFSDLTSLLFAVTGRSRIVCFHGPTARMRLTDFNCASMLAALSGESDPCGLAPNARVLRRGTAKGRLVGGNLALVAAMIGTPFAPDLDDSILFLEDVGERTYRVDRMLRQIYLSGGLKNCRGIVFGEFTECDATSGSGARELDEVLIEIAELAEVPCIAGAPIGHIDDQWTLPVGASAVLDADARTLSVSPFNAKQA